MLVFGKSGVNDPAKLETIFAKRPLLGEILKKSGHLSLPAYMAETLKKISEPHSERRTEFLKTMEPLVGKRFGKTIADSVRKQLEKYFWMSSADHHGSAQSSLVISSNALLSVGCGDVEDPLLQNIIVLSCSSVSQNNEDYPRGIMLHAEDRDTYRLLKYPLLHHDYRNSAVFHFQPYEKSAVDKVSEALQKSMRKKELQDPHGKKILSVLQSIYAKEEVLQSKSLCEQFSRINFDLWKEIFHQDVRAKNLLYIEFEEIVNALLIDHHMDAKTPLHAILFDPAFDASFIRPLCTRMEEFIRQGALGTYLFWGLTPDKNYRVRLERVGNTLQSADGILRYPLEPAALKKALEDRLLMPNIFTLFLVVYLYYGLNCMGGFNQLHYLDLMKRFYNESGIDELPCTAESNLYTFGLDTIFLRDKADTLIPVLGLDLVLEGSATLWAEYAQAMKELTLQSAFDANTDIIYGIFSITESPATP